MFQPLIFMYSLKPSKVTKMVARNVSIGRKIHKGEKQQPVAMNVSFQFGPL